MTDLTTNEVFVTQKKYWAKFKPTIFEIPFCYIEEERHKGKMDKAQNKERATAGKARAKKHDTKLSLTKSRTNTTNFLEFFASLFVFCLSCVAKEREQ